MTLVRYVWGQYWNKNKNIISSDPYYISGPNFKKYGQIFHIGEGDIDLCCRDLEAPEISTRSESYSDNGSQGLSNIIITSTFEEDKIHEQAVTGETE